MRKAKDEKYLHDSMVFYTSWFKQLKRLSGEQLKELIIMMSDYASTEEYRESDDLAVNLVFDTVKRELDINWANYEETRKTNRLNTLIRCIKAGQEIGPETIEFAKSIPDYASKYLHEHGISDADINKIIGR